MSNIIEKLTQDHDSTSLLKIFASLFCLSLIRVFLENYSSPDSSGYLFSWNATYLHIPLYFISCFLSFSIVLLLFSKTKLTKIFLFLLWINIFIIFPPIIDLLLTRGAGIQISYTLIWPSSIPSSLIRLLTSFYVPGITAGIHIAGSILVLSSCFYVYHFSKSILKSFLTAIMGVLIFFSYSILPSLLIANLPKTNNALIGLTYINQINNSILSQNQTSFAITEKMQQAIVLQDIFLGQLFWIFIFFQGLYLFKHSQKNASEILTTTVRTGRIFNYFLIAFVGISLSSHFFKPVDLSNIANIVSMTMFFLLLATILIWETFINDREDVNIDKVTNIDRPLSKGLITIKDWDNISNTIGIMVFVGILLTSRNATFFLVLLLISYYLYSTRPLRLKRHFASSSLLIGLATVSTTMAGFFLVSPDQKIKAFPISAIFIIGIVQALLSNLKDIKDYAGDKKEGIKTIPVVFGEKKAKIMISTIYALVFIFLPIYFHLVPMLFIALIISALTVYFINKQIYEEKYVFLMMFAYMLSLYFSLI